MVLRYLVLLAIFHCKAVVTISLQDVECVESMLHLPLPQFSIGY